MMTSSEIRRGFLKFFSEKSHTIVPSASLMPTSPNLLFTNAGMNQFVPYFLGEARAPFNRAADTQKCIRAGGKHNDLEDVGFDTYHHTFFEMLGNWSFGDYFKKEAIQWAWELLVEVWKFPKERLYVTVYEPAKGEPATADEEAYEIWRGVMEKYGLDPEVHIKRFGKKDNFWMMGETGPCGPCSEIHMDLTPKNDSGGALVNAGSARCMEIWNLVFMQFNAQPDGTYAPLKHKNIDTGMGLERVAGIMATTKGFKDFSKAPSNYDSDLFADLFEHISEMSGKRYGGTVPADRNDMTGAELNDCIFRVLADHIRTIAFSIADGIIPGNEGRNYVLRRILRRAVMYGKRMDLGSGFFTRLVEPLVEKMGAIFPELVEQKQVILKVVSREEQAFEKTLDRGLALLDAITVREKSVSGEQAFVLYDTYGFPIDLTELIARERGMEVDVREFEAQMERQRERARKAQKKELIVISDSGEVEKATQFVGYDAANLSGFETFISAIVASDDADWLIFPQTPFYGEKGGQVGDTGFVEIDGVAREIFDTKIDEAGHYLHKVRKGVFKKDSIGSDVSLTVDKMRRLAIQRHHSSTHILHYALRQVLGFHVRQAGSYVDEHRMRFDYSHYEAPTAEQLRRIEEIANKKILENAAVRWREVPYAEIPENCLAFFEDKYGAVVRVVEMGDFSAELCGGTHVSATGEIGMIKIISDSAISSGTRRLEAFAGTAAYDFANSMQDILTRVSHRLSCKGEEVLSRVEKLLESKSQLDKELKNFKRQSAGKRAETFAAEAVEKDGAKRVSKIVEGSNPNEMRALAVEILSHIKGAAVVVLGTDMGGGKASVLALCSKEAVEKGIKAGDIVRQITASLGGKGGGKPDYAQGGGSADKLAEVFSNL